MFHDIERVAKVDSVPGRGWYGVRRVAADIAEDAEKDERVLNVITGIGIQQRGVWCTRIASAPEVLNRAAQARQLARHNAVAEAKQQPETALRLVRKAKTA